MKAQENALLKQIMEEDEKRRVRLVEEERAKEVIVQKNVPPIRHFWRIFERYVVMLTFDQRRRGREAPRSPRRGGARQGGPSLLRPSKHLYHLSATFGEYSRDPERC